MVGQGPIGEVECIQVSGTGWELLKVLKKLADVRPLGKNCAVGGGPW